MQAREEIGEFAPAVANHPLRLRLQDFAADFNWTRQKETGMVRSAHLVIAFLFRINGWQTLAEIAARL